MDFFDQMLKYFLLWSQIESSPSKESLLTELREQLKVSDEALQVDCKFFIVVAKLSSLCKSTLEFYSPAHLRVLAKCYFSVCMC